MAYYDRPYYREETRANIGWLRNGITFWLIVLNVAIYIIDSILLHSRRAATIAPFAWGNYNIDDAIFGLQVWRLLTYQFLHFGLLHLFFNMLALYFFGPLLEGWWGTRRFLAFYLLCGMSGAVVFTALAFIPDVLDVTTASTLIGASGAVYGVIIGAATLYPHQPVSLLLLPITFSLRTMAIVLMVIVLLSLLAGSPNAGGEAAHLGGALLGWLLVKHASWLNWADRDWTSRLSPTRVRHKLQQRNWQKSQQRRESLEAEVDRILDKVQREGLQSLSSREKKTLQRATREKQRS